MTTTTPDQWDERRAPPVYRVHAERSYDQRVKAILAFNSCKDDLDAQLEAAWLAMLEHAKLHPDAAQPVAQEAIAWSLRFDDDPRLNLSTVFDTEDEAKNYAARCGSATPVPLFAAPHQPVSAEAGKGVVHQFRKKHCSDWYDGFPDTEDGGPYETRTLYVHPSPQALSDEEIDAIAMRLFNHPDNPLPLAEDWCADVGRPFARAIQAAAGGSEK